MPTPDLPADDWVVIKSGITGIHGREHFEGSSTSTFGRALEWLESGRADVEAIRPRTFAIDQYALALANDKAGSGAVKISFAL